MLRIGLIDQWLQDLDVGFNQTKVEDRKCFMCNTNMVEDEFHFLCQCPYYFSERKSLYDYVITRNGDFENFSDEEKFIFLMVEFNCKVGKFINKAWQKRKLKMYNWLTYMLQMWFCKLFIAKVYFYIYVGCWCLWYCVCYVS